MTASWVWLHGFCVYLVHRVQLQRVKGPLSPFIAKFVEAGWLNFQVPPWRRETFWLLTSLSKSWLMPWASFLEGVLASQNWLLVMTSQERRASRPFCCPSKAVSQSHGWGATKAAMQVRLDRKVVTHDQSVKSYSPDPCFRWGHWC